MQPINDIIKRAKHELATNPHINADALIKAVAKETGLDNETVRHKIIKNSKAPKVKLQTKKEKEKALLTNTIDIVASIIAEETIPAAAVAAVYHNGRWLLGRSTACDGRCDKWAFPGGAIKANESPTEAACREAQEELGIKCTAIRELGRDDSGDIVYVLCKATGGKIRCNHEFTDARFFTKSEIDQLDTYKSCEILNTLV